MNKKDLDKILEEHKKWSSGDDGKRADLSHADLHNAVLRHADLSYAVLRNADLSCADLRNAVLSYADLRYAVLPRFQIPQTGTLEVFKKIEGKIVKLRVPAKAKRMISLVGRKCRAEYVKVLDIEGGGPVESDGMGNGVKTVYEIGNMVKPDSYDEDIRVECSHGIHFFLTREEAEEF